MGLRLQLVRDGEVLFELPLEMGEWDPGALRSEIEGLEEEIPRLRMVYDALSNETRMRMLCEMSQGLDRRFSDLMDELELNQKIVSEGLRRMMRSDLLERVETHPREVRYRPSPLGFASLLMCVAARRVIEEMERENGE